MKKVFSVIYFIVAILITLLVTKSIFASADQFGGIAFHPFTTDPNNRTCVDWPSENTGNCDPIDLIFPDQSIPEVRDRLLSHGWSTSGFGSTQWIHFDDSESFIAQGDQLFFSYSADGKSYRYHLRLWDYSGTVFGAVHHEVGSWFHTIDMSWDEAEAFVTGQLCDATINCSKTDPLSQQLIIQDLDDDGDPDKWRDWGNDGRAALIPKSEPDPESTMHVSDLDQTASSRKKFWTAEVTVSVVDDTENPLPDAAISGNWHDGLVAQGSCTTDANGQCSIKLRNIAKSIEQVTFTVNNVFHVDHSYDPSSNIDPDVDSNGTAIVVHKAGTPEPPTPHDQKVWIGSLDGIGSMGKRNNWLAEVIVSVIDGEGLSVEAVAVTGSWDSGGRGSCTTDQQGTCTIVKKNIKSTVSTITFLIDDLSAPGYVYDPSINVKSEVSIDKPG